MDIGIKSALGNLVRDLRKERNISQRELADGSGMHINTIHLLEAGINEPKLSTFFFIAKGLEMDEKILMEMLLSKYYTT